jgi:hypothetical protein
LKKLLVLFTIIFISACGQSTNNDTASSSVEPENTTESVASSNSSGYEKIDWQSMDADKDGYVSPDEMVDHYNKKGVYN